MATHHTLISGTTYQITGGSVLIAGPNYQIGGVRQRWPARK